VKPGRFGAASAGSGSLDGSGAVHRDVGFVQGPNLGMLREARPHASLPSFVAARNLEPPAPRMHGADSTGGGPRQTRSLDIIESRDLELDLMENSSRSAAPCRPTTGRSARAKPAAPCARGLGAASSKTRSYFMTSLPSYATLRPRSRRRAGGAAAATLGELRAFLDASWYQEWVSQLCSPNVCDLRPRDGAARGRGAQPRDTLHRRPGPPRPNPRDGRHPGCL